MARRGNVIESRQLKCSTIMFSNEEVVMVRLRSFNHGPTYTGQQSELYMKLRSAK